MCMPTICIAPLLPCVPSDAASVVGLGVALGVALLLLLTVSILLVVAITVAMVQTVKLRVYEGEHI